MVSSNFLFVDLFTIYFKPTVVLNLKMMYTIFLYCCHRWMFYKLFLNLIMFECVSMFCLGSILYFYKDDYFAVSKSNKSVNVIMFFDAICSSFKYFLLNSHLSKFQVDCWYITPHYCLITCNKRPLQSSSIY